MHLRVCNLVEKYKDFGIGINVIQAFQHKSFSNSKGYVLKMHHYGKDI